MTFYVGGASGCVGGCRPRTEKATPPPPHRPCVTFTLLVVVSTSQPGVFVMTAYRALIRPSEEDAMGRSCILDSHPERWMPAAVRMPAVVRMPACHSRRFKGERPNRRRHRLTEPTTKALCQPPPPPTSSHKRVRLSVPTHCFAITARHQSTRAPGCRWGWRIETGRATQLVKGLRDRWRGTRREEGVLRLGEDSGSRTDMGSEFSGEKWKEGERKVTFC